MKLRLEITILAYATGGIFEPFFLLERILLHHFLDFWSFISSGSAPQLFSWISVYITLIGADQVMAK